MHPTDRSPSLPPPRHFVGNLTTQGLEEGTHFRPWYDCHGRSVFHDHFDKELPSDLVPLCRHCNLPGTREVVEESDQVSPNGLIRVSPIFGERSQRSSGRSFLLS